MSNHTESEFIIPAIIAMGKRDGRISTTELISVLRVFYTPDGEDIAIIKNRSDDYFSQKVRNLKAHNTLGKLGYANSTENGWELTEAGKQLFEKLSDLIGDNPDFHSDVIDYTNLPLQQIFYGAPGTGKSYGIKYNEKVRISDEKNLVFRTTFHPDSDYSTFVGAYKPTLKPVADKYKAVAGKDEEITYEFIPQAFLQAYIAAWNNQEEDVFLVIEEINRGNCAQIFGDLFQLLDRDDNGFSEYPIMADRDLAKFLSSNDVLVNKDGIKDGKLLLPANLYIWATMNTSDQSLFPIDSAFKRRWEWKYIPIDTKKEEWHILVNGHKYSWTSFLDIINDEVLTDETAEDKHLGFYFCKAENRIISAEKLVGKVLFYLWTDVFKVYGVPSRVTNGSKDMTYPKFYNTDGTVNEDMVEQLLDNLGVARVEPDGEDGPTEPDDNA